ncbi:MAG: endonuclease/exonuclease/phosphatase family protein [bacterium]|nr:endonuclease/exonuclease/phosphatase family protein [bacterium]
MTYNLLNYPGNNSASRNPEFRKILHAIDPDVLIVQEMQSSSGVNEFLNQVLNSGQPGAYSSAPFLDGPDTDNAFYYKSARVSHQGTVTLTTALRDINGYIVRPAGVTADSLDFRMYSAHLKASQGFEDDRLAEVTIVRNHLNALGPGHYIFGGDFNLYTSNEPAFDIATQSQADNDGRLYDVLSQSGSWHNSATFASIHTQSPRLTDIGDGGSTGGLDDRFDFLLPTYQFQALPSWQVLPGSYTEFGNDGNHFGQSINNGTNTAVPDSIADALHTSSDHLPVFMDIVRQVSSPPAVTILQPNGGQNFGRGDTISITWSTTNYTGTISLSLSRTGVSGSYETLVNGTANDGQFSWVASGTPTTQARVKVVLDGSPTTSDVSNNDFTISNRDITLFTPAQGDSVTIGFGIDVQWTAINVTGNVRVELSRSPSTPGWEVLAASIPNTGLYGWVATSPATDSARVRVLIASAPSVGDTSSLFKIKSFSNNQPPAITHNPVCDAVPGTVSFHCKVQDTGTYSLPYLIWTSDGFATKDSAQLSAATLGGYSVGHSFPIGFYEYYLRVTDSGNLTARTDTFELAIQANCPTTISYDDETAESYQWSSDEGMAWAVKFTPTAVPFVLCMAEYAVSVRKPDSLHGLVTLHVLNANGVGGMPGDTLGVFTTGTLPNLTTGSAGTSPGWGRCVLQNAGEQPLVVNGDFYVAVSEASTAFALDASSGVSGRSYVWDSCESTWLPEDGGNANSRLGDRMIRAKGLALLPPTVVISTSGNDAVLHWTTTGAPLLSLPSSRS